MSSISKMYILLQTSKQMKISEIADILEVDERTVRRYRDELEYAHIPIESIRGKNGGYRLCYDNLLLGLNVDEEEMLCLMTLSEELKKNNHILRKDFDSILNKLRAIKPLDNQETVYSIGRKENYNTSIERQKMQDIYCAIIKKNKLKMQYMDAYGAASERIVHPYKLIHYNGGHYIIAYCEKRNEIRLFKLYRIKELCIINEMFERDSEFDLDNFFEHSFGLFKDQEIELVLEIKYPLAQTIKEKTWVEGQQIIENEQNYSIIFKAVVEGQEEIIAWILSMGEYVTHVEPKELKNKVIEKSKIMIEKLECADICPN